MPTIPGPKAVRILTADGWQELGVQGPAGASGLSDIYFQDFSGSSVTGNNTIWTLVPIAASATISKSDGTNNDFIRNADGSMTILKAGTYTFAFSVGVGASMTGTLDARLCLLPNNAVPNQNNALTVEVGNYTAVFPWHSGGAVRRCAVNDRVAVWANQGNSGASNLPLNLTSFSAVLNGAGPAGPQGPVGSGLMEGWTAVGPQGGAEPAFRNSWVNFGTGYANAAFRKYPDGTVRLRGIVKSGTIGSGTPIFVLPVGYRPGGVTTGGALVFAGDSNQTFGEIRVYPDGSVCLQTGTNTYGSLDGIVFDTDSVSTLLTGPAGPQGIQGPAGIPGNNPPRRTVVARTTPQTGLVSGVSTQIQFDTETYDDGLFTLSAPNKLTVDQAGTYLPTLQILWPTAADGHRRIAQVRRVDPTNTVQLDSYRDDSLVMPVAEASSFFKMHVFPPLACNVGDIIYFEVNQVSGGTASLNSAIATFTKLDGPAGPVGPKGADGGGSPAPMDTTLLRRTTAFPIPNNTNTALPWEVVDIDALSGWNSGAPTRWTAPSSGRYLFVANAAFASNATGGRGIILYRGGVAGAGTAFAASRPQAVNGAETHMSVAKVWDLAAGEFIEVGLYQNSTVSLSTPAGEYGGSLQVVKLQGPKGDQGPAGPSTPIPLVLTLPTNPVNGQEVYYLADDANGVIWHLRYRTTSTSAYKWEVLGAPPPLWADDVATAPTTSSTTYVDLSTAVSVGNLPLAGDYIIEHGGLGANTSANVAAVQSVYIGAIASDADYTYSATGANAFTSFARRLRKNGIASGTLVKLQNRVGGSGTGTFNRRWLSVTPIRVG